MPWVYGVLAFFSYRYFRSFVYFELVCPLPSFQRLSSDLPSRWRSLISSRPFHSIQIEVA